MNDYINNLPYERTPQSLYEPVKYTLRLGGKRIRPVLMVLSYNLFKEDVKEILLLLRPCNAYRYINAVVPVRLPNVDYKPRIAKLFYGRID